MPVGNLELARKMLRCDWSVRRSTCTQTRRDFAGDKSACGWSCHQRICLRHVCCVRLSLKWSLKQNAPIHAVGMSILPTAITQPASLLSSSPSANSPLLMGVRAYHPWETFVIKNACSRSFRAFCPLSIRLYSPPRISVTLFFVAGGGRAHGRQSPYVLTVIGCKKSSESGRRFARCGNRDGGVRRRQRRGRCADVVHDDAHRPVSDLRWIAQPRRRRTDAAM